MGYTNLKSILDTNIKTNGSQSITGAKLNQVMTQLLQGVDIADRANGTDTTGMTYKILKSSSSFADQVTGTNTIYEIRDNFNLNGGSFSMPQGCILVFNGGKLSNGTLTGNRTTIVAADVQVFDTITFSGTFFGGMNACWIGAKDGDSTFDNSDIIQKWFDGIAACFKELYFPLGSYYFLSTATLTSDRRNLVLNGCSSTFLVNIDDDENGNGKYFLSLSNSGSGSSGEQFRIKDVIIKNNRQTSTTQLTKTRAVLFDRTQRFCVSNVQVWYFDIAFHLIDIWYGMFDNNTILRKNRVGILADGQTSYETNTIELLNVDFAGVTREAVAAVWEQESGESDEDYLTRTASVGFDAYTLLQGVGLRGCIFEGCDYGVRTNWKKRSSAHSNLHGGAFSIVGCYFEANRAEDIYIGKGNADSVGSGSYYYRFTHDISVSDCRFYTTKHVYMHGVVAFIHSNQKFTLKVVGDGIATSVVDYEGDVTIDGSVGASATLHKIGGRNTSVKNATGSDSIPTTNFQRLQQTRSYGMLTSMLDGYSRTSSSSCSTNVRFKPWNFETQPGVKYAFDILPYTNFRDDVNNYSKLLVPSGGKLLSVNCSADYQFRALNCNGSITLYEFMRRWKAGITYTGTIQNLFPFEVTANPTDGTIKNSSGTIVGFGSAALGTTITTSYTTSYLVFIDALVWVRISYSKIKQFADILQCGRTYSELRGDINASVTYTAYLSCYGSNANMANVQKRINAVYWDTTNQKLMIYNGFEWVEMTSPFQRYYYKDYGVKLAERATMADLPGQTFTNYATGITYTFAFRPNNNYKWIPSIGMVDSLDHPNGYSDDNTLDYANELSLGEMVMYNGALYKWNGTQLVAM